MFDKGINSGNKCDTIHYAKAFLILSKILKNNSYISFLILTMLGIFSDLFGISYLGTEHIGM
jgi:hypothetical protein